MLTGLLRALMDGRPRTMPELAAELGVDDVGLRLAFDHCERLGLIERHDSAGAAACERCGSSCACSGASCEHSHDQVSAATWWGVTESGRRAMQATSPSALRTHAPPTR
jgi:hypothetical protein